MPINTDPRSQVEVSRLDPETMLNAPLPASRKQRRSMDDLMTNAVPIQPNPPQPPPQKPAKPEAAAIAPLVDPIDEMVSDDLLAQLEREFGTHPDVLKDVVLTVKDAKSLEVAIRAPSYDDYIWALAWFEEQGKPGNPDAGLFRTAQQRESLLKHLTACRCVQKIRGQWIWDIFKRQKQIRAVNPHWTGDRMTGVPDFIQGRLTIDVFKLLRKLHPDLMFNLESQVEQYDNEVQQIGPAPAPAPGASATELMGTPADPSSAS